MDAVAWGECLIVPENESAVAAARQVARFLARPGRACPPSPLLLHGPTGAGKSALVSALIRKLAALPAGLTLQALPARDLPRPEGRSDGESAHLGDLEGVDFLALEDVQHLPARSVADLCTLLDRRTSRKRPTLLTADAGPAELADLPRRLTSRLAAGLVVPVAPLEAVSRRKLVQRLAARRRVRLTVDALDWLADQPTGGGVRPLFGQLERLATLSRGHPSALDRAAVERHLAGPDSPLAQGPVERVLARVAAAFGVSVAELLGPQRLRTVLVPRQVAMYLVREVVRLSFPQIGAAFAGRDHTTVQHACRKVAEDLKTDPKLRQTVRRLRAELS